MAKNQLNLEAATCREILTARLINDLTESPDKATVLLDGLDDKKLHQLYAGKSDLPNRTTKQLLDRGEGRIDEIEDELSTLLEGETDDLEFNDPPVVKEYLDRFVEGQDDAKKVVSIAIVNYLLHGLRPGVLLMGPSGCGKTYMLEILSKEAGIPFVKKSLANVSTEGFKGQNLSEGLEELLGAEQGILFLDEFDKIASNEDFAGFGPQIQNELLAYFTGEKIKLANVQPQFPIFGLPGQEGDETDEEKRRQEIEGELQGKTNGNADKKVTIYNMTDQVAETVGYENPVKKYLDSIVRYFRDQGIEPEFQDLSSGFEEKPREVVDALSRYRRSRGRAPPTTQERIDAWDDYLDYGTNPDIDNLCEFVVNLGGKYVVNPKRKDLETILHKQAREEREIDEMIDGEPEAEGLGQKEEEKEKEEQLPANVIDLSKILIFVAGAFHGSSRGNNSSVYSIVQRRLGGNTCQLNETELLQNVEDRDLIEYGFKPELIGRLTSRAVLKPLGVDSLYRILKYSEDSPLERMQNIFEEIGVTMHLDDPALLFLAEYAHQGIGVRGIHKALEELTKDFSFDRKKHIGKVVNFTRSHLEEKLRKEVKFEDGNGYDVDWLDINSIIGYLDIFVPDQRKAKVELARAFHLYHLRKNAKNGHMELPKSNVLLLGPSGSGKTYMVKLLSEKANLPIASTNATGKVPEGYGGTQLSTIFDQFSQTQKYGVVYIDEADKVILNLTDPLNNEFIGFLEDGEVRGRKTKDFLFILSGAFQHIYKLKKDKKVSTEITKEDLLIYGVREEMLGRIPIFVNVKPPTVETMVKVLTGPDSVVTKYRNYFSTQDYGLVLEEGVHEAVANEALKTEVGFRALHTMIDKLFAHYMVHPERYLADTAGFNKNYKDDNGHDQSVVVTLAETKRLIHDMAPATRNNLIASLSEADSPLDRNVKHLSSQGYKVKLEEGVKDAIVEEAMKRKVDDATLKHLCNKVFVEYIANTEEYLKEEEGGKVLYVNRDDVERLLQE